MNKPTKPKTESTAEVVRRMKTDASLGYAGLISGCFAQLRDIAQNVEAKAIAGANVTRQMGGLLVAWMDREQTRFEQFEEFFHQNASVLPKGFTSQTARKAISAHRNFPEEVTDLKTALAVLQQMTFFAVGLMEEPKRLAPQHASGQTPLLLFLNTTAKQREMLQRLKEEFPVTRWDDDTWRIVMNETNDAARLNAEARARLKV